MSNTDVLYTVKETAELLKCSKNYVYKLIECSLLQALKLGSLKITRAELLDFLERNQGKDLTDPENVKVLSLC